MSRTHFDALKSHRKAAKRLLSALYSEEEEEESHAAALHFRRLEWIKPRTVEGVLALRDRSRLKLKHAQRVIALEENEASWVGLRQKVLQSVSGKKAQRGRQKEPRLLVVPVFTKGDESPVGGIVLRSGSAALAHLQHLVLSAECPREGELSLPLAKEGVDSYCPYLFLNDTFSSEWDPEEPPPRWRAGNVLCPEEALLSYPENAHIVLSSGFPEDWSPTRLLLREQGRFRIEARESRKHAGTRPLRSGWVTLAELQNL